MANTTFLTRVVEQHVRDVLADRHNEPFAKEFLPLRTGGQHEFDAVARSRSVVASIKAASGLTAGGRIPDGKIKGAIAELYYLSLVDAPRRILVLTNPAFFEILKRKTKGAIADGFELDCIPLPVSMQLEVDEVVRKASTEVSLIDATRSIAAEVEDDVT
jgi:hypothetical protein